MTAFQFWQSVANTPYWTYLFFLYLLFFAYNTTKPQIVSFKALQIAPFVIIAISLCCMLSFINITKTNLGYWFTFLVTGFIIGWAQYRIKGIKASPDNNRLRVPGTYLLVMVICVGFFAKLYYGYTPTLISPYTTMKMLGDLYSDKIMCLLGLLTGMMSGRLRYASKVMRNGPYFTPA